MKILIVCQFYYPENFVITNIAEKLAAFGNHVTVLTGKPNYGYGNILLEYKDIKQETINNVDIERVNIYPRKKSRLSVIRNYLSFYFSSRKWVKNTKEKYDIVYSFSLSPVTILSAGNLYKHKNHVKHIVHCVDLWPESVLSTKRVRKCSLTYLILYYWSKRLYKGADEILIGSPSFEKYFREVLKLNNLKLTYIPQCSLVEKCNQEPYEYDPNYFNVLYCGNLGYLQNVLLIPEAMKYTNKKIKFHIIGMGPMESKFKNKIKELGLSRSIICYGSMNAKKASAYFVKCDAIYISLSDSAFVGKTIPNKIMMSMAFAKPIAAVIKGDGEEVLKSANGSIISSENPVEIAKTLNNLCSMSDEDRKQMGENNLRYFKENFAEDIVASRVQEALQKHLK